MAEQSFPFSNAQVTTELDWSRLFQPAAGDGVQLANPSDPALKVTANGTATISVTAGAAKANGFHYRLDTTKSLTVPTNFGNASPRVDRVVLRCSQTGNAATAVYVTGGTTPPPLSADRNDVWDLPLATVTIAAGSTVAAASAVVDERYSLSRAAAGFGSVPLGYGRLRYVNGLLDIADASGWHPIPLGDGPRCMAYQSGTGETLPNGAARNAILNSKLYDSNSMHPTTGDPAFRKVTVPTAGVYAIQASAAFDVNATGYRSLAVVKNMTISAGGAGTGGDAVCRAAGAASTVETVLTCGREEYLDAGNWLSLLVTQTSGGNLGLNPGPDRVFLQVKWMRSSL